MKYLKYVLLTVLAVFLVACGDDKAATNTPADKEQTASATEATTAYPKTFVDGRGIEVTIDKKPERIVSTTLAMDEYLTALTSTDNIVAVTSMSTDATISNVAGQTDAIETKLDTVTAEQVLALEPDLVIVPSYVDPEVLNQLDKAGITTYQVADDSSFDGILASLEVIGQIIGEEKKAVQLKADIEARMAKLEKEAAAIETKKRVLYYTEYSSSVTNNTTIGEMIQLAGGVNVVDEAGVTGDDYPDYPTLSKEMLVQLNPEVIFTTAWGGTAGSEPAFVQEWKKDPALADVAAIKNNQVYVLDGANITTASHFVIEGAEELKAVLAGN